MAADNTRKRWKKTRWQDSTLIEPTHLLVYIAKSEVLWLSKKAGNFTACALQSCTLLKFLSCPHTNEPSPFWNFNVAVSIRVLCENLSFEISRFVRAIRTFSVFLLCVFWQSESLKNCRWKKWRFKKNGRNERRRFFLWI